MPPPQAASPLDNDLIAYLLQRPTKAELTPDKNLVALIPQGDQEQVVKTPPDTIRVGNPVNDKEEDHMSAERSLKGMNNGTPSGSEFEDGDKYQSSSSRSKEEGTNRKIKPPKKVASEDIVTKPKATRTKAEKKEGKSDRSIWLPLQ